MMPFVVNRWKKKREEKKEQGGGCTGWKHALYLTRPDTMRPPEIYSSKGFTGCTRDRVHSKRSHALSESSVAGGTSAVALPVSVSSDCQMLLFTKVLLSRDLMRKKSIEQFLFSIIIIFNVEIFFFSRLQRRRNCHEWTLWVSLILNLWCCAINDLIAHSLDIVEVCRT